MHDEREMNKYGKEMGEGKKEKREYMSYLSKVSCIGVLEAIEVWMLSIEANEK